MTIKREIQPGITVEIELLSSELREACEEQQAIYDKEDVMNYIDGNIDYLLDKDDDMEAWEFYDLVPTIAKAYRKAIDNGAFDWWAVISDCLTDVLNERKEKKVDSVVANGGTR